MAQHAHCIEEAARQGMLKSVEATGVRQQQETSGAPGVAAKAATEGGTEGASGEEQGLGSRQGFQQRGGRSGSHASELGEDHLAHRGV
jgi:hypothetical protein